MESEFQRLENSQHLTCEDTWPSYSTDHGGELNSVLKKVHKSAVARAKATNDADQDYQRYEE